MFPTSRIRRRGLAAAIAVVLAMGLSACAVDVKNVRAQASAKPLSGVLATGTLVSPQRGDPVGGHIVVVVGRTDRALTVKLEGLTGNFASASEVHLSAVAVTRGASCTPAGLAFDAGPVSSRPEQSFTFPFDGSPGWQNPSFLHSLLLVGAGVSADGCASTLIAYASLKWSIADPRPDITVTDLGPRRGAEGATTKTNGRPSTYAVVAGDNLDSIAARFHLTLDDLFYLNPARLPGPVSTVTRIGEVLNLSKANR